MVIIFLLIINNDLFYLFSALHGRCEYIGFPFDNNEHLGAVKPLRKVLDEIMEVFSPTKKRKADDFYETVGKCQCNHVDMQFFAYYKSGFEDDITRSIVDPLIFFVIICC